MAFTSTFEMSGRVARITLSGELDASVAASFRDVIQNAADKNAGRLAFIMHDLEYIASAGIRVLIFAKQKMGPDVSVYIVGPQEQVRETLEMTKLIARLRDERGYTIVFIEHDMKVVGGTSDRVVVLDYGEKIAEGTYAEISQNEQVLNAYLGSEGTITK